MYPTRPATQPRNTSVANTTRSTLPMSAADTGEVSRASSASDWKVAPSMPGTSPLTISVLRAIFQPASPLANATTARTSSFEGGVPFLPRRAENAIEKQAAWAAAMSSSGEVRPLCSSVRDAHVTGRRLNAPDET
jgi:hypothetical protein